MSDHQIYPDLDPEVEQTIGADLRAARRASTDATSATRRTAEVVTEANRVLAALRARDDRFTERVRATIGGRQAS
jgi:hypothetical protein